VSKNIAFHWEISSTPQQYPACPADTQEHQIW
jgi:hypothetical protein